MPIVFDQVIFRPAMAPARDLPFGVRSMGYYKILPPFISQDKKINFVQLFWCVRGAGIIEIDGHPHILKKHQVALYYPNMRHYLHSDRPYWEYYWMTMDGRLAEPISAAFGLVAGIYDVGPTPVALFQQLRQLVGQPSKQAEIKAVITAFTILTRATGSQTRRTDELTNRIIDHLHQKYMSPALNIKTLAASLGVRRSTVGARFNAAMGMPPGAYLNRLRIQKALPLLQHTHLTIAKIAGQCGYKDANYFSRVIRHATGRSPLQFRRATDASSKQKKTPKAV